MSKGRKIKNTVLRFNLMDPADRQAWEHLQNLDREHFKSYSRAVIAALNDYFERQQQIADDPYLESREKEDAFLQRVLDTVEKGMRESMAMGLAGNLAPLLQAAMAGQDDPSQSNPITSCPPSTPTSVETPIDPQEQAEVEDAALDFADSF